MPQNHWTLVCPPPTPPPHHSQKSEPQTKDFVVGKLEGGGTLLSGNELAAYQPQAQCIGMSATSPVVSQL